MNIDNKNLNVKELPVLRPAEPIIFTDLFEVSPTIDDVGFMSAKISASLECDYDYLGINRSFTLIGVDGKAQVDEIEVGERFVVADQVIYIINRSSARPAPQLSIQPSIAAAVTDARDRNHVQAIAAVNALFVSGNEPKMVGRDVHYLKKVANTLGDPTRLFFRFAQMYYYYKQLEKQEVKIRPTPATPAPVFIDSITGVLAALRNGANGTNYLPMDLDMYTGDAATAVTILRYAAEGSPLPLVDGTSISSILTTHIALPPLEVLLTGVNAPNIVNPNFSSSEVWDVLHTVAGQIDCTDLAYEMISVVGALLHSPYRNADPIFRCGQVELHLPVLNMTYYSIFPICIAADAIVPGPPADERDMHAFAAMIAFRSQLLSVAFREVLWGMGLGGAFRSSVYAAKAAKWRRNLLSKARRPYAPVWGIMLRYLETNSCPVSVSQTMLTLTPGRAEVGLLGLERMNLNCSSWIDVLDVVPTAPAAAVDAYLNPKRSVKLIQPQVRYRLDNISSESLPSNVSALEFVNAKFEMIYKQKTDLNWKVMDIKPLPGKYGVPSDRPFAAAHPDPEVLSHIVVTIPNVTEAVRLHNNDQRRKGWKWYISGAGDKPANDTFDDDDLYPPDGFVNVDYGPAVVQSPAPETTVPTQAENMANTTSLLQTIKTVKEAVADPEAQPSAAVGSLSKRDQWTYDDLMLAAPGVLRDAASFFKTATLAEANQPGRDIKAHMQPLVAPLAHTLEAISFVQAVAGVERRKRASVMTAAARALALLASCTTDMKIAKQLCYGSERANNTAVALRKCSAVNTAELAEDGMAWNEDAGMVIECMADQMIEAGMTIADLAAPQPVGVDTQEVDRVATSELEAAGWKRARKQEGVATNKVKMYRPKQAKLPQADFDSAQMLIIESAAEVERRAQALLDELTGVTVPGGVEESKQVETVSTDTTPAPPEREDRSTVSDTQFFRDTAEFTPTTPAKVPMVIELPPGMQEEQRRAYKEMDDAREEQRARELQQRIIGHQFEYFEQRKASYTDPSRIEYVHSKELALKAALVGATTARELAEAMIKVIGEPRASYGAASAPSAEVLARRKREAEGLEAPESPPPGDEVVMEPDEPDFQAAGALPEATLAGSLEQPQPTGSVATPVGPDEDEFALGPPPEVQPSSTTLFGLDPLSLDTLETL